MLLQLSSGEPCAFLVRYTLYCKSYICGMCKLQGFC